jgi:hypothetical protein
MSRRREVMTLPSSYIDRGAAEPLSRLNAREALVGVAAYSARACRAIRVLPMTAPATEHYCGFTDRLLTHLCERALAGEGPAPVLNGERMTLEQMQRRLEQAARVACITASEH